MTSAVRNLLDAHEKDSAFGYLDFLGVFDIVEKWMCKTKGQIVHLLDNAGAEELLGLELSDDKQDDKLEYILGLLREHAHELNSSYLHSTCFSPN